MNQSSRRHFLRQTAAVTAGFSGLGRLLSSTGHAAEVAPYGPLVADPKKILDLPKGFEYKVISKMGQKMDDGYKVPGQFDGMGAFDLDDDRTALVRNHEIGHIYFQKGPFEDNAKLPDSMDRSLVYDPGDDTYQPFVGGTTTLIYNRKTGKVESQHLSLLGTDRNCAGGPTPWGSWITCEEPADTTSEWGVKHGYCFEVPSTGKGLTKAVPLKAMGRMRHEAIAIHESSGMVFLTEDRNDGCIYRFIPNKPGALVEGGKLQALAFRDLPKVNTCNWPELKAKPFPVGKRFKCDWVDLKNAESPKDTLRFEAQKAGAARFSRGEGMWFGSAEEVGEETIYWACTDGGTKKFGQIFRYFPTTDEVELFIEPNNRKLLSNADNVAVAPWGDLFICEDTGGANHLRGVTADGGIYTLARNAIKGSELAGACMSGDGSTLFMNIQASGMTLAITGPWQKG